MPSADGTKGSPLSAISHSKAATSAVTDAEKNTIGKTSRFQANDGITKSRIRAHTQAPPGSPDQSIIADAAKYHRERGLAPLPAESTKAYALKRSRGGTTCTSYIE